jgi:hypothetical protein
MLHWFLCGLHYFSASGNGSTLFFINLQFAINFEFNYISNWKNDNSIAKIRLFPYKAPVSLAVLLEREILPPNDINKKHAKRLKWLPWTWIELKQIARNPYPIRKNSSSNNHLTSIK